MSIKFETGLVESSEDSGGEMSKSNIVGVVSVSSFTSISESGSDIIRKLNRHGFEVE
jgi:hypothetical protein